jgi:predicted hydrocarbon binding protein
MSRIQEKQSDEEFWKDFPTMADYFSPAVTSLQKYLGIGSKEIFYFLGEVFSRKVANRYESWNLKEILLELSRIWESLEIGRLEIENANPLTLLISDCRICGQLAGTGGMYECAFHEGFFRSVLSNKLSRKIDLHQETNFEGTSGTWCRRFVADVKI